MFDVGFWEILLIALVGLVVIGPQRMPAVARTLGLWTSRIRRSASRFRADLENELRAQELRALLDEEQAALREPMAETAATLNESLSGSPTGPRRPDGKTTPPATDGAASRVANDE